MPATSPKISNQSTEKLSEVGKQIRKQRKKLGVSATATAEAAGVSRVTLHRIEKGLPSVTIGAYFNVLSALNLNCVVNDGAKISSKTESDKKGWLPASISLAQYPQLKQLAWHIHGIDELTPIEALGIYQRNARFIENEKLSKEERDLIDALHLALDGYRQQL